VALGHTIYRWCPKEGRASKLMSIPHDESLSSLKGNFDGTKLSLGYDTGLVKIFDIETQKIERTMKGQEWRVGCMSWSKNELSTGSRDKTICIRDMRESKDYSLKLKGHKQEVCGVAFSPCSRMLASGGNDNLFFVWDTRKGH